MSNEDLESYHKERNKDGLERKEDVDMSSDTRNTRVMEERVVTAGQQQWLDWIVRIQSLAQAGLHYGHDRFDLERYAELRDIAAKMMAAQSDLPLAKVRQLFCNEEGYQTPKIDTRAAIFQDGKLLLVHESTGKWSLPIWNRLSSTL